MDRFGPRADRGINFVANMLAEQGKGKPIDQRLLKDKVVSCIGIGGSDWCTNIEYDHMVLGISSMWKTIDNQMFSWSKTIFMDDEEIRFVFPEEQLGHAHDTMPGKKIHADDIRQNEGESTECRKSEKWKASQERLKTYDIPEILPPSKR